MSQLHCMQSDVINVWITFYVYNESCPECKLLY